MIELEKSDGFECPDCGCSDSRRLAPGKPGSKGWFGESDRQECRHCGRRWIPEELLAQRLETPDEVDAERHHSSVIYHVIRCPKCRSKNTHVASTRRPIRQHKCDDCGHPFKSIEHDPE